MKKLVIKTILITLISLFAVILIAVTAFTLLAPKKLSNYFYDMGNEKMSVWYIELQYQKTSKDEDLQLLLFRANEAEDYARIVKYSKEIIGKDNYEEICKNSDKPTSSLKYDYYVKGNYVIALYKTKATMEVITQVADTTVTSEYSVFNAYQTLISSGLLDNDKQALESIKEKLLDLKSLYQSEELDTDYNEVIKLLEKLK